MADLGRVRVCIVGGGFSGLAAAIELRRAGVNDLVILERAASVGGAWRDNTYPGCACDVKSRLYELRVAPWPDWSRVYSGQEEIRTYLERVVEIFGLDPYLRLETELIGTQWDGESQVWRVETSRGYLTAEVLISACGGLTEPLIPDIAGTESFRGKMMHTARWDHDVDLTGKRVAVIGTGASAIQVIPALAPNVEHLIVCQRTPAWVMPRNDHAISGRQRRLFEQIPIWQALRRAAVSWGNEVQLLSFTKQGVFRSLGERIARRHLMSQVHNPDLRDRLTPTYAMGCKRILISDDYYPTLMRHNVTVAPGLRSITQTGIVTDDGVEHPVDAIIWATGFAVLEPPLADRVTGRDGGFLADALRSTDYAAYRGTAIHGFPNMFILQGPNTGLGHSSVVLMSEAQIDHLIPAVTSGRVYEVTEDAQRAYVESVDERLSTTVWQQGGCRSWYQNGSGRNIALWPGSTHGFARMMGRFDPRAYRIRIRKDAHVAP